MRGLRLGRPPERDMPAWQVNAGCELLDASPPCCNDSPTLLLGQMTCLIVYTPDASVMPGSCYSTLRYQRQSLTAWPCSPLNGCCLPGGACRYTVTFSVVNPGLGISQILLLTVNVFEAGVVAGRLRLVSATNASTSAEVRGGWQRHAASSFTPLHRLRHHMLTCICPCMSCMSVVPESIPHVWLRWPAGSCCATGRHRGPECCHSQCHSTGSQRIPAADWSGQQRSTYF